MIETYCKGQKIEGVRGMHLDELVSRITEAGTFWNVETVNFNFGLTVSCLKSKITEEGGSLYFKQDKDCRFGDSMNFIGIADYRKSISHATINSNGFIFVCLLDGSILAMVEHFTH